MLYLTAAISDSDGRMQHAIAGALLMHRGISGATATRALSGFGSHQQSHGKSSGCAHGPWHQGGLVHSDRPIVITVVDTPENIGRLIPEVAEMIDTGLMATSQAEMIRVRKTRDL
jgi:PII-like signaling protein